MRKPKQPKIEIALSDSLHDRVARNHYVVPMLRHLRTFAEFIAAFVGVLLLVSVAVIWRLSASPLNSTFLTPYIEAGIERLIPDAHPQIAHTLLTWDNVDHSLALHADGIVIKNGKDNVIAEVPNLDIRLSVIAFVVGQFLPTELTVDHPQIKLNRHADGRLFFADMQAMSNASGAEDQTDMREALRQAMAKVTHAYAMRHLTIYRAVIEVHDEATNTSWSVSIPEISLKHTLTQLVGNAKIDLTQKDKPAELELHYVYDHIKGLHRVSTRFQDITPSQLVGGHPETFGFNGAAILDLPLSGEMEVAFDPNMDIADAAATLHGGVGFLRAPLLWDKQRSVSSLDIEGDFDSKAHKLNIITASFDFDGAKFDVTGEGHAPADATKYDLDFKLLAHIQNVPMDGFGDLWPKPIVPNARDWMIQNLKKGAYNKGEASFTGSLSWKDLADIAITSGQGKISASHGVVTYIDGMPPVQDVSTEAHFDLQHMVLQINEGNIGDLHLQPFTATITGLSDADQYIDIPLKVTGPIVDVVKLINYPPLRYADRVGLAPDAITGTAEGTVNLHFELLKTLATDDIDLSANAKLSNVASSQLVKGINLSQGELALDLDKKGFTVKGPLTINKLPFDFSLQQAFSETPGKPLRQINVSGTIKDDQWKMLGIDALTATRGSAVAQLQIADTSKTKTLFTGSLDLAAADLRVESFSWKKPVGVPALVQFNAEMTKGKDILVKSMSLRSPQANAEGNAVVSQAGIIKSVSLEPLVIGRTSADVYFTQSEGADGALRFEARGKSLDISGMKGGKDPQRADPRPKEYHLNVDKLYTSDNGLIAQAEGFAVRDGNGWSAMGLHGLADGDHKFTMDLTPEQDGSRSFSVRCDDFGKMLKGLGFTDTVKEGEVTITGASTVENPHVINGTVKIGSFSVGKLPVLALLLNATSPFGFSGIITDSASFEHLKGTFRWTGDTIEAIHVNAAGSSVGMNINGRVDMNSGQANLNGTLVPFSMVNRILGSIPILGDLLTGGDGGGILAVAYDIKGSLSDPKIDVHPVSLLTPGFLRNLFFGDDDSDEAAPEKGDKVVPAAEVPAAPVKTQSNIDVRH